MLSAIAALAAVLGAAVLAFVLVRVRTYVPSPTYAPAGEPCREVAVAYYSFWGHSEAVAREIARTFNAPIARIDADYPHNWGGLRRAGDDARSRVLPDIRVEPIDLMPVRRLFLVGPTWWYRPATPLWACVERTDLTGREVVLVTTANRRFRQAETAAFAARVEARGGRLVAHIFLARGFIFWQQSRAELLAETRTRLAALRSARDGPDRR